MELANCRIALMREHLEDVWVDSHHPRGFERIPAGDRTGPEPLEPGACAICTLSALIGGAAIDGRNAGEEEKHGGYEPSGFEEGILRYHPAA